MPCQRLHYATVNAVTIPGPQFDDHATETARFIDRHRPKRGTSRFKPSFIDQRPSTSNLP